MFRSPPSKGAALLAVIVTSIVLPLSMLIAYAPDGNDAAGGFEQAKLTAQDTIVWVGVALAIFVATYALAAAVLPKHRDSRGLRNL